MKRIYKYILQVTDFQTVPMPKDAEILSAQLQDGELCLWAIVNPDNKPAEERKFEVFGTGNPIPTDMGIDRKFIATVQEPPFVWHVFELTS